MTDVRAALRRFALRLLARSRGEVRAIQDLRLLVEVGRFAGVFAITLLLPAATLSWLALSSIRSEELSLDADLRARATAMSTQVGQELSSVFVRFEDSTRARLRRGESPITELQALSPYLRGAYRFDATGSLVAPFELPPDQGIPVPSAAYLAASRIARATETRDPRHAVGKWEEAAALARDPTYEAEARLGAARAEELAGDVRRAEDLLADLFGDHALTRDPQGFRYGDLALLRRGEIRMQRDPEVGSTSLQQLVDDLLAARWSIGLEGEAAVVREALALIDGRVSPDWTARARARLNDRYAQLAWSTRVAAELEAVPSRVPEGTFRYLGARNDSPALWAIARDGEDVYVWSFDAAGLYLDLNNNAKRLGELDADLDAQLLLPGDPIPEASVARRALGPWLPVATLVVLPDDPEALSGQKQRRRYTRIAIVLIAVFMVSVGVINAAWIIGRELESARMKADFAANVSHELRSPITQIRLKGEALQLGLVDEGEDQQQHYDAIVLESERLSRLVDNVLDFAAIERGAKTYHLRRDDLMALVWGQCEGHRATIEERGLELELDLPEDLPVLHFDREAIGQVLTNLLSNASKYGADGRWVGVKVRDRGDHVTLEVSDRGMGIAPDELKHVFDEFFRSGDPEVRRRKGTGIGLAIVRYIVEAHGGSITVHSTRGSGTAFTVSLPTAPPEASGA